MLSRASSWLRISRLGMLVLALSIGFGAGLGAVAFRSLIFGITWLVTGREQFGQAGRVASVHLPWLGIWFVLLVPVLGGLLYGPLIQRFAPEARGHGVPEVMIAVAEDGGRIRPQVTGIKALASALCIGVGGSVGREGPIVQIGSALASSLGQVVHMSESRLRILVACGAAGGISATFNAPITGVFFGFELILREFSIDALFPIIMAAVMADVIGQAFFGSGPIFSQMPHNLVIPHDVDYLLVALLAVGAAFIGVGFKTVLYRTEDVCDRLWKGRPEWCRPAVGGIALGAVLLALPQLYGVGYPVMTKAVVDHYVLWFLVLLALGKIVAASLTIGIGGSGGVFAPSLFAGAMAGTAFGVTANHLFGPAVGSPAIYGVIAMGAVFAAAAQAPLTSIASVVEMTGNYALTLPVMLAVGLAVGVSKRLTYGTIYTTKLLRRGTDIDRPKPSSVLQVLTVADVMQPLASVNGRGRLSSPDNTEDPDATHPVAWTPQFGEIVEHRRPQVLFGYEMLEQALRQLVLYGPEGLPVLSSDRDHILGWITHRDIVRAIAGRTSASDAEVPQGSLAAEWATPRAKEHLHVAPDPIDGYDLVEIRITEPVPAHGRRVDEIELPRGSIPAAISVGRQTLAARCDTTLQGGDRLLCLVPVTHPPICPGGDPDDICPRAGDDYRRDALSQETVGPILRHLFHIPLLLYRWNLTRFIGNRFMLLVHVGRRTGLEHRTVLEVMRYEKQDCEVVVMSGFGRRSDWYLNIQAGNPTQVVIGKASFAAHHRHVPEEEAIEVLADYERRTWYAAPLVRWVLGRLAGWSYDGSAASRARLVHQCPLVAFTPAPPPK